MPWRELLKADAISKLLRDPLEASSGSERSVETPRGRDQLPALHWQSPHAVEVGS
jgi:hypothetical protein